jgi:hypothetical protein
MMKTKKSKGQFLRYGGAASKGVGGSKIVRIPPTGIFVHLRRV